MVTHIVLYAVSSLGHSLCMLISGCEPLSPQQIGSLASACASGVCETTTELPTSFTQHSFTAMQKKQCYNDQNSIPQIKLSMSC